MFYTKFFVPFGITSNIVGRFLFSYRKMFYFLELIIDLSTLRRFLERILVECLTERKSYVPSYLLT